MPLGFGLDVSTGTSTPFISSGNSSKQSLTILGYLHSTTTVNGSSESANSQARPCGTTPSWSRL